jgi:hypothetical protein
MTTDKKQIGLRVPDDLREKIQAAANARGVAVNREISDRLEKSFNEGMTISAADGDGELYSILRVVAAAMDVVGPMAAMMSTLSPDAGKTWIDNSIAYEQAFQAAVTVLNALRPQAATVPHPSMPDSVNTLGTGMAAGILHEAVTGRTITPAPAEIARAQRLHAGLGALAKRIKPDQGPVTVKLHVGTATLTRSATKKGKRK